LGLAVCRSLVRLMNGDIEVESAPGTGAIFRFHVVAPLLEAASLLPKLPKRTVALVSANAESRQHYVALLKSWGLDVTPHETLRSVANAGTFDVLMIDVFSQDAAAWLRELAAPEAFANRPLVGLVSAGVPAAVRDELRPMFRTLLKKPVREAFLHAVLA